MYGVAVTMKGHALLYGLLQNNILFTINRLCRNHQPYWWLGNNQNNGQMWGIAMHMNNSIRK